ncbi:sodium- and chloride-dependent neutral and basic amino acid transporter B(0+) domain protein [Oesophagostomum dentatum]|uniref:Sodium-and chloride-dependent neutral and basic amino acid transporter B(0+) domain protein n=1 Tax=Oesophagostomum dentatum TaxID=61180 RepID=A0A0B1SWE5_OESDE|nr:sodium- and chloride-dependent neutral and basic amino acid transporter B(0+) domain protein [Oesophagostomum dentatum]
MAADAIFVLASIESVDENERGEWTSETESLLATISLTVGLGSLWRFPRLAYQNGGSAFLIPYSACMILFGFPMLYLEMMLGQYSSQGPSTLFGHFIPALQGLGWTMAFISFTVGVYYCVIVAWSFLYLFASIAGQTSVWGKCNNAWNDIYCVDAEAMRECKLRDPTKPIAFNGSCFASVVEEMKTPYDQYFTNVITRRSDGIDTYGGINWATLFALTVIWLLVALTIMKGYVYLGKTAYVVSVAPYVIVAIVFCRAVTLEGAIAGVLYYFGKPDFRTLLYHETWSAALIQVCFTLNIGYGGIIMIASYNRRHNNCYRDAWITVVAVVLMSIIGGVVVFATLGFVSQQLHKPLHGIVSSGLSIVFVAYLEAMHEMPYPFIWSTPFFATLFFLGFGSVMGRSFSQHFVFCLSLGVF